MRFSMSLIPHCKTLFLITNNAKKIYCILLYILSGWKHRQFINTCFVNMGFFRYIYQYIISTLREMIIYLPSWRISLTSFIFQMNQQTPQNNTHTAWKIVEHVEKSSFIGILGNMSEIVQCAVTFQYGRPETSWEFYCHLAKMNFCLYFILLFNNVVA